jgi:dUTP pyrophosphatase
MPNPVLALTPTDPFKRMLLAELPDGDTFTPPPDDGWPFPVGRATPGSYGMDVAPCRDVELAPGEAKVVATGWSLAAPLPEDAALFVLPRSSLFLKHKLLVANSPGLIDRDYAGDLGIVLYNPTAEPVTLPAGQRVAQLVLMPVLNPDVTIEFTRTDDLTRGGFGSTDTPEDSDV